MKLTRLEVEILHSVLEDMNDKLHHYPNNDGYWSDEETAAYYSMGEKVYDEAKRYGFWWAR